MMRVINHEKVKEFLGDYKLPRAEEGEITEETMEELSNNKGDDE